MRNQIISSKQAEAMIVEAIRTGGFPLTARDVADEDFSFGFPSITFNSGTWADEASVDISRQRTGRSNVNDEKTVTYSVKINWSCSRRTVSMALTALNNYKKAIDLAANLEALISGFPTVVEEE